MLFTLIPVRFYLCQDFPKLNSVIQHISKLSLLASYFSVLQKMPFNFLSRWHWSTKSILSLFGWLTNFKSTQTTATKQTETTWTPRTSKLWSSTMSVGSKFLQCSQLRGLIKLSQSKNICLEFQDEKN